MIEVINKNVFDSEADCIINTINCVGSMGKGLALEFALRYPELEKIYVEECKKHLIHTGQVYFYTIDNQKIINFPTKFHYKYPSQIKWIEQGLDSIIENYKKWNIKSLGIPLLGAKNGGLNPDEVIDLIKKKLEVLDIPVYICLNSEPDKLTSLMLERFNSSDPSKVAEELSLNENQRNSLISAHKKISHFVELTSFTSIGLSTYKKLYKYYQISKRNSQLNLFEL